MVEVISTGAFPLIEAFVLRFQGSYCSLKKSSNSLIYNYDVLNIFVLKLKFLHILKFKGMKFLEKYERFDRKQEDNINYCGMKFNFVLMGIMYYFRW